jgi:fatty-acyl-CoA synthase
MGTPGYALLWPDYRTPADLPGIESVPLAERGLPESTYAVLSRAAALWPERTALSVLPTAAQWRGPATRSFGELLADVHRAANLLNECGIGRGDAVGLISPNCDELIAATLAAQAAAIAAPINGALAADHIAELLRRAGTRVLVAAGPELDAAIWEAALSLAGSGTVHTLLALPRAMSAMTVAPSRSSATSHPQPSRARKARP